ncbi:MAG: MFS transporter [Methanomassiliicoccales archaeon]
MRTLISSRSLMLDNKQLWAISTVMALRSCGMGAIWPYMAIFLDLQLHVQASEVGESFAGLAIGSAVFQIIGGHLADNLGRRSAMLTAGIAGAFIYLTMFLLLYFHAGPLPIIILFLLTSASGGIIAPAATAIVADVTKLHMRESGYAIYRVLTNIGWAAGSLTASFLYIHGMIFIILMAFVLVFLQLLLVLFSVKETSPGKEDTRGGLLARFAQLAVFDVPLLFFSFSTLLITIMISQFSVTLSLFSAVKIGISVQDIGFIYALNGLIVILGQLPAIRIVERINDLNGLTIGTILYAAGYFFVGFSKTLPQLLADMVVITMGENFTTPTISTIVSKLAPSTKLGRFMAFNGMSNSVGRALGPALGSVLLFVFAQNYQLWLALDGFGIAGLLFLLFLSKSGYLAADAYAVARPE